MDGVSESASPGEAQLFPEGSHEWQGGPWRDRHVERDALLVGSVSGLSCGEAVSGDRGTTRTPAGLVVPPEPRLFGHAALHRVHPDRDPVTGEEREERGRQLTAFRTELAERGAHHAEIGTSSQPTVTVIGVLTADVSNVKESPGAITANGEGYIA